MKRILLWALYGAVLGLFGYLISSDARAQLVNPPTMNFNDSPMNFNNSPSNFNNSPYNFDATNGIYSPDGARIGYSVMSPTGVTNLFDNNGGRMGFIPAPNMGDR